MKELFNFVFTCLLISQNIQSQNKIDWNSDLDYLDKKLPKRHINLFTVKEEEYFRLGIKKIKENTQQKSDLEIALSVQQLLAEMGDSHTSIDYKVFLDKNQTLPIQLYYYSDGLYVLATIKDYADIVGCKILSVNQIPLDNVIDSLSTLFTVDNESSIKNNIPQYLPYLQLLNYFNLTENDSIELKYSTSTGDIKSIIITPTLINKSDVVSIKPEFNRESLAPCYKNKKRFFTEDYIVENKIYYLQYNKCSSRELEQEYGNDDKALQLPSFAAFENGVIERLKSSPIEKFVFDLRYNSGGNSKQGTEFIKKLSPYFNANPNTRIYVVVGRQTFSSAILNALDFKTFKNVVFIILQNFSEDQIII